MNDTSYQDVVRSYSNDISKTKNVKGIILTGSAGREDRDILSDIDNVVLTDGESGVIEGKKTLRKYLFDTRILDINKFSSSKWSQDMYFAYLNGKIIYDFEGNVQDIIDQKKKEWEDNLEKNISLALVNMSVIYCFRDNWKGLKTDTHFEKFIKRKDYVSAHRVLNFGQELLLDVLYLINRERIPDTKSKIKLITELEWLPKNFLGLFNEVFLIKEITQSDAERRYCLTIGCLKEIKVHINKNFKLKDNLYQFYLTNRD